MSLALVASGTAVPKKNSGPICQDPVQPFSHLAARQMCFSSVIASDAFTNKVAVSTTLYWFQCDFPETISQGLSQNQD